MGILGRLGDLFKSNVNDVIDKMEDPEKQVKQIIIDMEDEISKTTQAYGQALGTLKSIERQIKKEKENSLDWENKAKAALSTGNEDLARQALEKKASCDKLISEYETNYNNLKPQIDQMVENIKNMKTKLEEARNRQNIIVARSQMADAQTKTAKALGNVGKSSAFSKLDKMERKVEDKESQAEAFTSMSGVDIFNSENESNSDPFEKIEKEASVNSEMERLKKEMGL